MEKEKIISLKKSETTNKKQNNTQKKQNKSKRKKKGHKGITGVVTRLSLWIYTKQSYKISAFYDLLLGLLNLLFVKQKHSSGGVL